MNRDEPPPPPSSGADRPTGVRTPSTPGLALAALVLGVVGLALSLVIVGALVGVVGLVLGIVHLRRSREARRMAWSGFWLSAMSLVASVVFFFVYAVGLRHMAGTMGGPRRTMSQASLESWKGKACPDFTVTTLDGTPIRMSELAGRRVVINLWATWCGPCVQEIPHFIALSGEVSTNELMILGLSSEDRTVLKAFASQRGIFYPVASLTGVELPAPFHGIGAVPTTFFIDRDGRIEEVVMGYQDLESLRQRALGRGQGRGPEGAPQVEGPSE